MNAMISSFRSNSKQNRIVTLSDPWALRASVSDSNGNEYLAGFGVSDVSGWQLFPQRQRGKPKCIGRCTDI